MPSVAWLGTADTEAIVWHLEVQDCERNRQQMNFWKQTTEETAKISSIQNFMVEKYYFACLYDP